MLIREIKFKKLSKCYIIFKSKRESIREKSKNMRERI